MGLIDNNESSDHRTDRADTFGVVQSNMAGWEIAVYETETSSWENHP